MHNYITVCFNLINKTKTKKEEKKRKKYHSPPCTPPTYDQNNGQRFPR